MSRPLRYERLIRAAPEHVVHTCTSPEGRREFYGTDRIGVPRAFDRLALVAEARLGGGERMSQSVLYMSMSLDGFITGPDDDADHGLGVNGVESAMAQSKAVAGDADVMVHEIHLVPVLLGDGRRLFAHLGRDHIDLERVGVVEGEGGVTHPRYRVVAA